ncbi:MAG TPA: pyridoxal-dependent decarboxylase [Gemmatimonadaceae bacterium]|nr:pyridoxal-dependent decarboxylase [Gemmatimonadaceae bacterium]
MPNEEPRDPAEEILAALEADMTAAAGAAFADVVADYFAGTRAGVGAVSTALTPAELAVRFAEPLPQGRRPLTEVVERVRREIVRDANQLYHPMYIGHQVSAPLPAAVWAESVTAALNQSIAVWEMSPTLTVLEAQVIRWCCDLVGFGPAAGGTLTSGGTEATFTALLAARAAALPDAWRDGVGADPPVIVCGEHAHYAVTRAAGELGLGMRSVVVVPSDGYRMSVPQLVQRLDALAAGGRRVMAVVATAGSTATGSFDDLDAIGRVCEARSLWLHVDGAHGASALLSSRHRHRVRGLERARSLAWDPHKMLLLPLSAGMVLVRDEADLATAFSQQAPYLFHAAAGGRSWDSGPRSFQCSRRGDVLKLWVALQRYGADGLGLLYDRLCDMARMAHEAMLARPEFEPLHAPESNILCFRYRPDDALDERQLDRLNQELRERYNRSGRGWITSTLLDGRRVLRLTVMNPRTGPAQLQALLDGLAELGGELRRGLDAGEAVGAPATS